MFAGGIMVAIQAVLREIILGDHSSWECLHIVMTSISPNAALTDQKQLCLVTVIRGLCVEGAKTE